MVKSGWSLVKTAVIGLAVWVISVVLLWASLCLAYVRPVKTWRYYEIGWALWFPGMCVGAVALGTLIVMLGGLLCDFLVLRLRIGDETCVLRASKWRIRFLYLSAIANIASATCACLGGNDWNTPFLVAGGTQAVAAVVGMGVGTWIINRARSTRHWAFPVTLLGGVLLLTAGALATYWVWEMREAYPF